MNFRSTNINSVGKFNIIYLTLKKEIGEGLKMATTDRLQLIKTFLV